MNNPTEKHMATVYRILKYLKKSPSRGLHFKKNSNKDIEVYSDADWARSLTDRKSTTRYCTFVLGNLVTWRSKKQSVIARNSVEAKYSEGIWVGKILEELKVSRGSPMKLFCDNQATISIAKNPV